jgi:uncharacterized membrane-anchored protein YjiN (DUF445 family)
MVRYQIAVWGTSYVSARAARDQVIAALNSLNSLHIKKTFWENELDVTTDAGLYGTVADWFCFVNE